MTLIEMYEEAKKNNKLPKEFERWEDLRTWAITNRYKAEYGYKGEFTPEGCLKAMPDYVEKIKKLPEKESVIEKGEEDASKKTSTRSKRSKSV